MHKLENTFTTVGYLFEFICDLGFPLKHYTSAMFTILSVNNLDL